MIKFTSKNGHKLYVHEKRVPYLRKWCNIHSPRTFNACLGVEPCIYESCTTCPRCLNYTQEDYTPKEKMEAIQELFDTYCKYSIRGNTIIGLPKPIIFKELEK
jgi:hypothetical protein